MAKDGSKLSCKNCPTGYGRSADLAPVAAASAPLNCTMLECDGTNQNCGCSEISGKALKSPVSVATDYSGNFICKACGVGTENRNEDTAPVTATQKCTVIQCTGQESACGCPANKKVTFSSNKGTCSDCAVGYVSEKDSVPVSATRQCTLAACDGTTASCGCLSPNNEITENGGKLTCTPCAGGYERAADSIPATAAKKCTLTICDGTNSLCGCKQGEAVENALGRKFPPNLVCAACAAGFDRPADSKPVNTKAACTIIKCAGSQTKCGCPKDNEVTGSAGKLDCNACSAGFYRKADTAVAVSAPSPCKAKSCEATTVPGSMMYSFAKFGGVTGDTVDVQCSPGMKGGGKVGTPPPYSQRVSYSYTCPEHACVRACVRAFTVDMRSKREILRHCLHPQHLQSSSCLDRLRHELHEM